ncbi:MAG: site-2 protease family protein [Myxococcaceae bacterium]
MRALFIIPTLLSLTVHEWAHAWSAWKLGDDTAAREGRLTLNPIAHIDPIGTILLPLIGVPFGWAKPVPVNPVRFNRKVTMGTGMAITAAAGPISNILLALLCAVVLGITIRTGGDVLQHAPGLQMLLLYGVQLNVGLAIFNFVPVPPLDGSRILKRFIPRSMEDTWESVERFGPFLLFAVIASGGFFLQAPIAAVSEWMFAVVRAIAVP